MSTVTDETASGAPAGPPEELLGLAERVAGWARSGEDIEVYVARGTETEVRAYGGEVESLTSATSAKSDLLWMTSTTFTTCRLWPEVDVCGQLPGRFDCLAETSLPPAGGREN